MADRYHTVILVPHTRAKLRKWRISVTQLRVALVACLVLGLGSVLAFWLYFRSTVDQDQVTRLHQENENLRETNQSFEASIRRLQQQLSTYEDRTRQLAIVAGISSLAGNGEGGGIGGTDFGPGLDAFEAYLESAEVRASRIDEQLDQIAVKLEERQRWIASTPSITPVKGLFTSGFGFRKDPQTGKQAFHPALDIAAPVGYPIVAPADGVVTRAGRIGGLGKAVYLSHGFGINTRFGHMSRLDVRPGQEVKRGEIIGYVGSTGRSTGYHLHYEVHVDGKAVNPLIYMIDRH